MDVRDDSPVSEIAPTTTPLWKRSADLLFIIIVSPLLVPLFLVLGAYIKLASPGPIFFRQTRIGKAGKPFTCFKFRTMNPKACAAGHEQHLEILMNSNAPMTKLDRIGDTRLIVGGALLRSTGLDELPQLLNVLKGEMSVVGPRPCLPYELALYSEKHKGRLVVLPGITGLWQVTGKNRTTFEEMVALDIAYARNLSFGRDLSIMARTAGVLFRQLTETISRTPLPPVQGAPVHVRD